MNTTKRLHAATLGLLAATTLGGALQLALAADAPPPPPPAHERGRHHEGPEGGFMQILHKLDLSADQKHKIHAIMGNERDKWRSDPERGLRDLPALGNPGDPQHQAAVQAAKARAVERIEHWSAVEDEVYAVLTPAQQARLPQLLAELQQEIAARHGGGMPPPPPAP